MLNRLTSLPLIVVLMGICALAMYPPAAYAIIAREWASARAFFYSGTIFLALTAMIAIATQGYTPKRQARSYLLALLAAFTALPLMLAVPLWESIGNTSFLNAYFEMVSSLTTTGATVFDDPLRLSGADHLWRALVGWLGGFLIWVTAVAILAPLNLGGYEVLGPARNTAEVRGLSQITRVADVSVRLQRYTARLVPIYVGLTVLLWLGLLVLGDRPLVAVCHAMSVLASSGISPIGGTAQAASGVPGEMLILAFFAFALTRATFANDTADHGRARLLRDPEMQTALVVVLAIASLLFLRHWVGALEVDTADSAPRALSALWGGIFTVLSFLTTTGFEGSTWQEARNWSGLSSPGLILLGLAMIGGGVATTAGGVKLLRVYVLYMHGRRELERLVHPNSVGGSGQRARRLRREGAYVAWIFFMLFAISIAAVMLALSLSGLDFEQSVVLSIAALSTTGPLAGMAGESALSYASLSETVKLILAASMVLGRLETLAIIALLNPEFWRS